MGHFHDCMSIVNQLTCIFTYISQPKIANRVRCDSDKTSGRPAPEQEMEIAWRKTKIGYILFASSETRVQHRVKV